MTLSIGPGRRSSRCGRPAPAQCPGDRGAHSRPAAETTPRQTFINACPERSTPSTSSSRTRSCKSGCDGSSSLRGLPHWILRRRSVVRLTPHWSAPVSSPRPRFDPSLAIWQDRRDGSAHPGCGKTGPDPEPDLSLLRLRSTLRRLTPSTRLNRNSLNGEHLRLAAAR